MASVPAQRRGRSRRSSVSPLRGFDSGRQDLMELLENRTLFGGSPFPTIGELENPNNTVVRVNTSFGDIDLEMFDSVTPITVANFLHYVRDGDFDQSVFHRLVTGFVLQGGGFRYDSAATSAPLHAIPTDPAIQNEFNRSNVARTIAMAKFSGNPNSATSQWFINLGDNSSNLDNQNGGFTVFGRVLNDASWNVVTTIAGLQIRDLSSISPFNGSQFSANFSTTPTTSSFMSPNIPEDGIVRLHDVEIIKAGNIQTFYTQNFYYPEGFAGSTINEFLPIGNPTDSQVFYQVIVRSEVVSGNPATTAGWFRDRVVSTGSIPAHTRGGITMSAFGAGGAPGANDLVPQGVPYSIEVQATGRLSPNLSHYDFGTSTGEAFTDSLNTTWGFARSEKNNGTVFDFLVWSNPNSVDAHIQITFYFQTASPVTVNVTTDAFRRGGFAFQNVAQIPDHTVFSAKMTSDLPIVAAISHYNNSSDQFGSTALGIPGSGSEVGVVPSGVGGAGVSHVMSFLNPNSTPAVVTMVLRFENPAQEITVAPTLVITGNHRQQFDLATLQNARVVAGDPYSVRYSVVPGGLPVYADSSIRALMDEVGNPAAITTATVWDFGEGFMDPGRAGINVFETISVYNPNSVFFTGQNHTASITLSFIYNDGFVLTQQATAVGGGRYEVNIDELQAVLDQGTNNHRFFYSVRVTADIPIIAQMFHYDLTLGGAQASGGFSTLGLPSGTVTRLDQL